MRLVREPEGSVAVLKRSCQSTYGAAPIKVIKLGERMLRRLRFGAGTSGVMGPASGRWCCRLTYQSGLTSRATYA
jgi:hypothetical protein